MIKQTNFIKEVPASAGTIFEILSNVQGGLQVILDNTSADNVMVYKFEESYDGITWVDKEFPISADEVAATFTIQPLSGHILKVTWTRAHLRLTASGNLITQVGLQYRVNASTLADDALNIAP